MTYTLDALTDLTLLHEEASLKQLQRLVFEAQNRGVAGVCVYPKDLIYLPTSISRVTVINFPSGDLDASSVLNTLDEIFLNSGVEEVDYVFPYRLFLNGDLKKAFLHYRLIAEACQTQGCLLKVILETGAFSSMEMLRELALNLIQEGCRFLKTSTGKIAVGATFEAVLTLLQAILASDTHCGIKVSGGIRTDEQASAYVDLAENILQRTVDPSWFRIGRSLS